MVEKLVRSGRYQNASEVLREGLRLVEEREKANAAKLKALREAAQVGIDAIERGEYKEFASARDLSNYLREVGERVILEAEREQRAECFGTAMLKPRETAPRSGRRPSVRRAPAAPGARGGNAR